MDFDRATSRRAIRKRSSARRAIFLWILGAGLLLGCARLLVAVRDSLFGLLPVWLTASGVAGRLADTLLVGLAIGAGALAGAGYQLVRAWRRPVRKPTHRTGRWRSGPNAYWTRADYPLSSPPPAPPIFWEPLAPEFESSEDELTDQFQDSGWGW